MAVNDPDDPDLLPCGESVDALLRRLRAGRPSGHERRCPHCRAAAEELRVLSAAQAEADREAVAAPPDLVDQVMRTVRAEADSGGFVTLDAGGRGWTRMRREAVAALLRAACDTVPGTAVGRCRFSTGPDGIAVELTARFTGEVPAPRLADELRRAVRRSALHHLGRRVTRVDVRFQ